MVISLMRSSYLRAHLLPSSFRGIFHQHLAQRKAPFLEVNRNRIFQTIRTYMMPSTHTFPYRSDPETVYVTTDVHIPDDLATKQVPLPIVIYYHGGAWSVGEAKSTYAVAEKDELLDMGFVVVIPDFRLCPQVKLEGQMEDAAACLAWCQDGENGLCKALSKVYPDIKPGVVDPAKVVAMGCSSGAQLALFLGNVEKPPKAILDFYGPKEFSDPFFHSPNPAMSMLPPMDPAFIAKVYDEPTLTSFGIPLFGPTGPNLTHPRLAWVTNILKEGTLLKEVVPDGNYDPVDPIRMIEVKKKAWPPTVFIHGTKDDLIPYRLTEKMEARLKDLGVETEIYIVEGGGHGFDVALEKMGENFKSSKEWEIVKKGLDFLKAHV